MKTSVSAPPPPPAPVDPGQASLDYITKMADPELQRKILAAEQQFRPEYTRLNLAEQQQYLLGIPGEEGKPGQLGAIGLLQQTIPQLTAAQETADRLKRDADIRSLQSQSGAYLSALMQANPAMFAELEAARGMGGPTDFFKDYEKALANRAIFGDVQVTPASAALVQNVAPVNLSGYTAAQGTAPMLGAAPTAQANLLGAAPTIAAQGYGAEGYGSQGYNASQMVASLLGAAPTAAAQGYDAARAARVADIASRDVTQGALGQQLYGQAMRAAPTTASETFRRRAAEMAVSTGQIGPEELRNAQQATREAFAARGLEMSNQAIAGEAMARAEAVRQRQAQDIQQAAALNQAYLADLNASRGFATGVYGQDLGMQQANQAAALQAAQANQAMAGQLSLADQAALNQAAQFGAQAQNVANLANAEQAARFQMANQQAQMQAAAANQAALNQAAQFGATSANEAAQFAAAARNQAAQFGAQAQNVAAQANADMMARYAMANQAAQNQFGLANVERAADFLTRNQAVGAEFGLANLGAQNTAAQFGADAANRGALANLDVASRNALANQATQTQVGLSNQEMAANLGLQNRAAQISQQQQNIANLGLLGQARQGEMGANRAFQSQLVGMHGAAFDPMATVLGRPSGALGVGQQQQGFAAGMQQAMGGNVFDPNAGVNLALQNQANLGNYQAATYGARAGAQGAMMGGLMSGLGSAFGGLAGAAGATGGFGKLLGCWVAREVYGEESPRWIQFREWMMVKAPSWFKKLYFKYGEGFAAWLKNKPRIKSLIRKWMDSRINNHLLS